MAAEDRIRHVDLKTASLLSELTAIASHILRSEPIRSWNRHPAVQDMLGCLVGLECWHQTAAESCRVWGTLLKGFAER